MERATVNEIIVCIYIQLVVQRVLAASQDQMNQIFQQKLTSTDAIIQECVRKVVHTEVSYNIYIINSQYKYIYILRVW